MLVILKPIYLYIYDPAGQLLGGALGGHLKYPSQHQPPRSVLQDFSRTITSIRNDFQNCSDIQGTDHFVRSCPTSPPTAHQFMPQNWQNSPQQPQQQQRRSASPQPQPRPQSQQSQPYSPAASQTTPRRQPFPLRKPEVIVKEYPGCASTGNYRLNSSNQELSSSSAAVAAASSPHLLRPSKFWPQPQQHSPQLQQSPVHPKLYSQQQQMHRQTSQPCLATQQTNHVFKQQNTSLGADGALSPSPSQQQSKQYSYNQSAEDLQSLLSSFEKQPTYMWTNRLNRGQSKSSAGTSPVNTIGYNRSNSAFSRPQSQSSRSAVNYLQQPFEPAFGRQAITPPPCYTYDYHRSSPPPPLVNSTSIFGRPQSALNGSVSIGGGGYFNRSPNGSTDTMEQYHSASSTLYSSKPNLIIVSRSPLGSNSSVHQQQTTNSNASLGQSSNTQQHVPQQGAKPFYYTVRP